MSYSDCSNGAGWGCAGTANKVGDGGSGGGGGGGKRGALKFAREVADQKRDQVGTIQDNSYSSLVPLMLYRTVMQCRWLECPLYEF